MNENLSESGQTPEMAPVAPVMPPIMPAEVVPPAPKKSKLGVVVGILVLVVLGLAAGAYAYFVPVTPEKAVQKMVMALEHVNQMAFDGTAKLDMTINSADAISFGEQVAGTNTTKVSLTFGVNGKIDMTDESKPVAEGSFNMTGEGLVVRADYKLLDKNAYIRLVEVPFLGFFDTGAIKNQWIKIDESTISEGVGFDVQKNLTDDQKKQEDDAFNEFKPISLGEKLADEKVNDKAALHYKVNIDKDKLVAYLTKIAQIEGETEEVVQQTAKSLEDVDFSNSEIWIGKKDYLPYRMKMDVSVNVPEDNATGVVSLDVSLKDFNVPIHVDAPADAKSFEEIFGNLFGSMVPSTNDSSLIDPMMFDPSYDSDGNYY